MNSWADLVTPTQLKVREAKQPTEDYPFHGHETFKKQQPKKVTEVFPFHGH